MSQLESSAAGQHDRRQTESARPQVSSPKRAISAAKTISRLQRRTTKPKYTNNNSRVTSFPGAAPFWRTREFWDHVARSAGIVSMVLTLIGVWHEIYGHSESKVVSPTQSSPPQYTFTQNITNNSPQETRIDLKISSHRIRIHFHSGHRHHPKHTFRVSVLHNKWRTEGLPGSSRFILSRH